MNEVGLAILQPEPSPPQQGRGGRRKRNNAAGPEPAGTVAKVSKARLSLRDLLDEAAMGIGSRPARLILTMVGTVAGIAALVSTLGLGQTAGGQIAGRFDAVAATRITIAIPTPPGQSSDGPSLSWDAADRVLRLAGVAGAATVSPVDIGKTTTVAGVHLIDPTSSGQLRVPVFASSPGLLAAEGGQLATGRFFDAGHNVRGDHVAVLGARAAAKLGINRVDSLPSIFIGNQPYAVIGILAASTRRDELLDAVIIPNDTAVAAFSLPHPAQVDIVTALGAAQQVARQAGIAVSPAKPTSAVVTAPPPPGDLSGDLGGDVNSLFLAFGAVALIVGGLGIANVTLLSVLERTGEIGLRRALGAKRRHIACQFLTESAVIGLIGGLIGAALGVFAVLTVSIVRHWTPILDTRLALAAPLIGVLIGLLSGAYPSMKAAAIEPITALRQAS